ncbi:hypothetical protein EVAR_24116_1 [Eumeta japonica]|uniref:Uncharacterized protein n=1 Tax=Eumeta variegata TaxID=151549 RepID=A0A4C1YRX5_EUMVA|nr:hypothetical protein EVAR_24116_1 [Eumeta japonica]
MLCTPPPRPGPSYAYATMFRQVQCPPFLCTTVVLETRHKYLTMRRRRQADFTGFCFRPGSVLGTCSLRYTLLKSKYKQAKDFQPVTV